MTPALRRGLSVRFLRSSAEPMDDTPDPLDDARLALALVAADPSLGGVWLKARVGPALNTVMDAADLPAPVRRIHPSITDEQLFGGIDLEAALATGALRQREGVIARAGSIILTMAERCEAGLAARLAGAISAPDAPPLIAIDEAADPGEGPPESLTECLAFHVDLTGVAGRELEPTEAATAVATASGEDIETLVKIAAVLGVNSLRAPIFAVRAAAAAAGLAGRTAVEEDDIALAVRLVLAPRATRTPVVEEETAEKPDTPPPPQDQEPGDSETAQTSDQTADAESLTEAEAALLPDDLLALMAGRRLRGTLTGAGVGQKQVSGQRGRPLPSRPGRPGAAGRLDMLATLRAAAPMQRLRGGGDGGGGLKFRKEDLRLRRYQNRRERLVIFAVDLSGSAARARLAEAKGAVELMLSRAYEDRDQIALVGFRGKTAEVLLPPTRSLVMTKKRLAEAMGGGGTPLASGLAAAFGVAERAKGAGMTPQIVTLTDGRANVALDGAGDRTRAAEDALKLARAIGASGYGGCVIDTGRRPEPKLTDLAAAMDAAYAPLPHASPDAVSAAVTAALAG